MPANRLSVSGWSTRIWRFVGRCRCRSSPMQLPALPIPRHATKAAPAQCGQLAGEVVLREKELGIWHVYSWAECRDQVRLVALGLKSRAAAGRGRGPIGRNRPELALGRARGPVVGCMTLGIYEDVLAGEAGYLCHGSRCRCRAVRGRGAGRQAARRRGTDLRLIVYHDDRGMRQYDDDPRLVAWERLQARGAALLRAQPSAFEAEVAQGQRRGRGILCTTSGTTAEPKLAMLQHRPFLDHIAAYLRADPRLPTDEYVSSCRCRGSWSRSTWRRCRCCAGSG